MAWTHLLNSADVRVCHKPKAGSPAVRRSLGRVAKVEPSPLRLDQTCGRKPNAEDGGQGTQVQQGQTGEMAEITGSEKDQ